MFSLRLFRPFRRAFRPRLLACAALLLAAPLARAGGQGMYLSVDAHLPSAALSVDGGHCLSAWPQGTLGKRQYVEADNGLSCLLSPSWFSISIWSAGDKVATYEVRLSAFGSQVETRYKNPAYKSIAELYPHYAISGTQDWLDISATGLDTASWMSRVPPKLRINQLVLPGSHDSGTADLTQDSAVTPDASAVIAHAASIAPGLVAGWSKAQGTDVAGQLRRGVRYFDLRLCGGSDVQSVYTCHAMSGEKLVDIVQQVKSFVTDHPSELVILDMNHWYVQPGGNATQMRASVFQYLYDQLGPMLAGRDRFGPTSTLGELQAAHRTVIAAADQQEGFSYLWRSVNTEDLANCGGDICSYWPASSDLAQQTQRLGAALDALRAQGHSYLFVVQTQLTPDTSTILDGLGGDASNLLQYTGTYKYQMESYLDTPGLFKGLSGLILIEDFTNGIDLTERAMNMMGLCGQASCAQGTGR